MVPGPWPAEATLTADPRAPRRIGLASALVALLAAAALAGCLGPRAIPAAVDLPSEASQSGVAEPFVLHVMVVEERPGGAALAGAAVVAERPGGGRLVAARTGPDGSATLRLAPGQEVALAVGGLPSHTDESVPVPTGPAGGEARVEAVVYKARLPLRAELRLPPEWAAESLTAPGARVARHVPMALHPDADLAAAYAARLVAVNLTLRWSNEPTRHADLFAGVGFDGEVAAEGADAPQGPLDGAVEERVAWTLDRLLERAPSTAPEAVVLTTRAAVAPQGLAVTFEGEAAFAGRAVDLV